MQKELIATGKTTEEAIESGLAQLNLTREDVEIEVIEASNKGLFGFIGQKDAKVLIRVREDGNAVAEEKEVKEIKENGNENEKIIEFVTELLKKMGVDATVEITVEENIMKINLSGEGMGIVIGRRGETLDAVQHIVQLFVNKTFEKFYKVRVDTEDYRAKREEALTNLANGMAKRVMRTRKEIILEPMKAYERRIIHTALQNYNKIKTYSIGDEPNRKIIVAYKYTERAKDNEAEATEE